MVNTKHTPGPWKPWPEVKGSHPDHLVYISIGAVDGGRIASTGVYGHRKGQKNDAKPVISEAECRANARLIAAAPTMAETGRKVLGIWDDLYSNQENAEEATAWEAFRKALHDATGDA